MEQTIEVRYAGVVIGRATGASGAETSGSWHSLFFGIGDPMPVGTVVGLQIAGDASVAPQGSQVVEGMVEQVIESADPAKCGMRVRFDDPAALSLFGAASAPARPARTRTQPPPAAAPAAPHDAPAIVTAAPASPADGADSAGSDGGDGDADHGAAPDSPGGAADSGAQAGGGGRRRRRRR